uniref:Protein Vpu n=2 Tax=Human immunodeficiency virus type 1 TaxID=11676 RepID=M4TBN7_HV1|nr:vpu protein [Human immunodeficiency virus 1]
MLSLLERVDYRLGVGALIIALIIAIVVWSIAYLEYRKLLRQRKIDRLIERIRERAEDSGNESDGDAEELAAMGDVGHLRLLDLNDVYCDGKLVGHSLLWGTCVERSKSYSLLCIRC